MSEMIKRVAQAILDNGFTPERPDYDRRLAARAAIEAMRDDDLRAELTWRAFCRKFETRADGCWQWIGAIDRRDGYGRFYDGSGKTKSAYRYAFEHENGSLPEGLVVDHICNNRACVNPAHLRAVTNAENVLRGNGITAEYARARICKRGHPMDEANTYVRPSGERMCRACQSDRERRYKAGKRAGRRAMIDAALK